MKNSASGELPPPKTDSKHPSFLVEHPFDVLRGVWILKISACRLFPGNMEDTGAWVSRLDMDVVVNGSVTDEVIVQWEKTLEMFSLPMEMSSLFFRNKYSEVDVKLKVQFNIPMAVKQNILVGGVDKGDLIVINHGLTFQGEDASS